MVRRRLSSLFYGNCRQHQAGSVRSWLWLCQGQALEGIHEVEPDGYLIGARCECAEWCVGTVDDDLVGLPASGGIIIGAYECVALGDGVPRFVDDMHEQGIVAGDSCQCLPGQIELQIFALT